MKQKVKVAFDGLKVARRAADDSRVDLSTAYTACDVAIDEAYPVGTTIAYRRYGKDHEGEVVGRACVGMIRVKMLTSKDCSATNIRHRLVAPEDIL